MPAKKVLIKQPDDKTLLKEAASENSAATTLLHQAYVRQLTNYTFKFTDIIRIIEDSTLTKTLSALSGLQFHQNKKQIFVFFKHK